MGLGAVAVVAVAGGLWFSTRAHKTDVDVATPAIETAATPVLNAGPAVTPTVAASNGPAVEAPAPLTVTVEILPPTASVEVDGVPTPVLDKFVTVSGLLGSVHSVHVVGPLRERELTRSVAITESGASPARLNLNNVKTESRVRASLSREPVPVSEHAEKAVQKPPVLSVDKNFE